MSWNRRRTRARSLRLTFPGGLSGSGSRRGLSDVVVGGLGDAPNHFESEWGNDLYVITADPRFRASNSWSRCRGAGVSGAGSLGGHGPTLPALSRSLASSYPPDG